MIKKNGQKRGKQSYRCQNCFYRWVTKGNHHKDYFKAYQNWLFGRRTISEICSILKVSHPKLLKEFDKIRVVEGLQEDVSADSVKIINLQIDATFFGREYGFLVFHDCKKVIYFKEIKTESVKDFREGIIALKSSNYCIHSITIDGRRGYINNIRKLLGKIPIQMCLFHQKAIIRRYITDRPRSQCGKDLKELMNLLCKPEEQQNFINQFDYLQSKYHRLLHQRNEFGEYKHNALRAAFRSLDQNMLYLFTYTDVKNSNIPPTINHLEGLFSHLKERIKIHRGLDKNRKKKAVRFLLKNWNRKSGF